MPLSITLCIALGTAFSWICLYALIPRLHFYRLIDHPNNRSSHRQPTPRGGGTSFVLCTALASVVGLIGSANPSQAIVFTALPLVAVPLAFVGFLDDSHDLPASLRYGVQLATAFALILLSPLAWPWLALPLLLIATTAVINFTNFMDGLDGLVAGCMAITVAATCLKLSAPWPLWVLVGALLGFLLWNWSPATVFMGDVGSTFLGAVFAGLVLQAPSWTDAIGLLLLGTPLLGDAGLCVLRRLLAGQPVFKAHRLHLFQRLHQAGWTHARVASLYIAATTALAVALLWSGWQAALTLAVVGMLVGTWLDQRVAVPFAASLAGTRAP